MNCLQYLRDKHGISQGELSQLCSVSRDYISRIENAHVMPSIRIKRRLVDALSSLMECDLKLDDVF